MRTSLRRRVVLAAAFGSLVGAARAEDAPPSWLLEAAHASSAVDPRAPAVVLLDEREVTIAPDGRARIVERRATKVLTREGRADASAVAPYGPDAATVRSLSGWLLRAGGGSRTCGKADLLDVALVDDDVYDEARAKVISAGDAQAGDVFGAEWVVEERPLFMQDQWPAPSRLPSLLARYRLTLPQGWRAAAAAVNHPEIPAQVAGTTFTWELRDRPFVAEEPASPPLTQTAARLLISYAPTAGAQPAGVFAAWNDVSRWYSELADPQAEPSAALVAKARELTREARTPLEQVRALAAYVQSVNYISVQIGIGRFRPHGAADVMAKGYGDCKDKANLMRALLKAVGIPAYLVLVHAGDPTYVRAAVPSPVQFDHCIVAVVLDGPAGGARLARETDLGPLLFFDPTDPDTRVGDLPAHEQGGLVLVSAGARGVLVSLPELAPEAGRIDTRIDASIDARGDLTASVRLEAKGQAGAALRRVFRGSQEERMRRVEKWLGSSVPAVEVKRASRDDDTMDGVALGVDLAASQYAQLLQHRLIVVPSALLPGACAAGLGEPPWIFPPGPRTQPVRLANASCSEAMHLRLPDGFVVDEMPKPLTVESPLGTYESSFEALEAEIVAHRRLTLRASTVSAAEYGTVTSFFDTVRTSRQAALVLAKR